MQIEYIEERKSIVVSGVESKFCWVQNLKNGSVTKLQMDNDGMSLMVTSNNLNIFSGDQAGQIYLWDLDSFNLIFKMKVQIKFNIFFRLILIISEVLLNLKMVLLQLVQI